MSNAKILLETPPGGRQRRVVHDPSRDMLVIEVGKGAEGQDWSLEREVTLQYVAGLLMNHRI